MSENEAFMAAIQEDVLMGEEKAREEEEMEKIERGEELSSNDGGGEDYEDDDQDQQDQEDDEGKLETVGEGNETNVMSTGEKGMGQFAYSGSGIANLRNVDNLGNEDDAEEEDYGEDDGEAYEEEEKEDYEFWCINFALLLFST